MARGRSDIESVDLLPNRPTGTVQPSKILPGGWLGDVSVVEWRFGCCTDAPG